MTKGLWQKIKIVLGKRKKVVILSNKIKLGNRNHGEKEEGDYDEEEVEEEEEEEEEEQEFKEDDFRSVDLPNDKEEEIREVVKIYLCIFKSKTCG